MKFGEIKNLSNKELQNLLQESRDKLRSLRFEAATKKLRNPKKLGDLKRTIARVLTVLNSSKKK